LKVSLAAGGAAGEAIPAGTPSLVASKVMAHPATAVERARATT